MSTAPSPRPLAPAPSPVCPALFAAGSWSGPPLSTLPLTDAVAVAGVLVLAAVAVGVLDWLSGGSIRACLADAPFGDGSSAVPPASALSEEEAFVVELLERHDGQTRQSTIVEASEWSKSKVSRLLSSMEAEGYVEKRTVGRENVISLPGEGDGE